MSTNIIIEPELKTLLKRLKLSKLLDTLPERLASARAQKTPYQDFLMLLLSDEVYLLAGSRREDQELSHETPAHEQSRSS